METAKRTGRHTPRSIEEIPAFREHLRRAGISFAEFEKRQALGAGTQPDIESATLNLARKKLNLNQFAKGKS